MSRVELGELPIHPVDAINFTQQSATLLCLDVPVGAEFAIDYYSCNTGPKFRGVKMIPPGSHYIHCGLTKFHTLNTSTPSTSDSSSSTICPDEVSPFRYGFWLYLSAGDVVVRRWVPELEMLVPLNDADEEERYRQAVRRFEFDQGLGRYPLETHKKWWGLSCYIPRSVVEKVSERRSEVEKLSSNRGQAMVIRSGSKKASKGKIVKEGDTMNDTGESKSNNDTTITNTPTHTTTMTNTTTTTGSTSSNHNSNSDTMMCEGDSSDIGQFKQRETRFTRRRKEEEEMGLYLIGANTTSSSSSSSSSSSQPTYSLMYNFTPIDDPILTRGMSHSSITQAVHNRSSDMKKWLSRGTIEYYKRHKQHIINTGNCCYCTSILQSNIIYNNNNNNNNNTTNNTNKNALTNSTATLQSSSSSSLSSSSSSSPTSPPPYCYDPYIWLLGEFQMCFLCLLVGHEYQGFSFWSKSLETLCQSDQLLDHDFFSLKDTINDNNNNNNNNNDNKLSSSPSTTPSSPSSPSPSSSSPPLLPLVSRFLSILMTQFTVIPLDFFIDTLSSNEINSNFIKPLIIALKDIIITYIQEEEDKIKINNNNKTNNQSTSSLSSSSSSTLPSPPSLPSDWLQLKNNMMMLMDILSTRIGWTWEDDDDCVMVVDDE